MSKAGVSKVEVIGRSSIPRCPKCNSSAVRKREMIVKTGTYDKFGGSAGFTSKSSVRIFLSRGRNHWVDELKPMSYLWPCLMALILWGIYDDPDQSFSFVNLIASFINILWFMAVYASNKGFREEWACSRCGEVWNPAKFEESVAGRNNTDELRDV